MTTAVAPRPTRTRHECGHTKKAAECSICTLALTIPAVVSIQVHPDEAYHHPTDLNRWLEVGFRYACGHVRLEPVPEADEDHLGFVRQTARALQGCPDEKGVLLFPPRKCPDCWTEEDSARVRARNRRLAPWLYAEGE